MLEQKISALKRVEYLSVEVLVPSTKSTEAKPVNQPLKLANFVNRLKIKVEKCVYIVSLKNLSKSCLPFFFCVFKRMRRRAQTASHARQEGRARLKNAKNNACPAG